MIRLTGITHDPQRTALPDGGAVDVDLDILETYQGVLGLAWDAPADSDGEEGPSSSKRSRGPLLGAGSGGFRSNSTMAPSSTPLPPLPPAVAEGLAGFCAGMTASDPAAAEGAFTPGAGPAAVCVEDPLDPSPRFLYEALRHVASASRTRRPTHQGQQQQQRQAGAAGAMLREEEGEGLDLHLDVGVSILSFSGARRIDASPPQPPPSYHRAPAPSNATVAAEQGARRRTAHIEVIYQPIARLGLGAAAGGSTSSSGSGSSHEGGVGQLELLSTRPIRWPGDVRTQPRDLVEAGVGAGGGWEDAGGGAGGGQHHEAGGLGTLVFLVAAVCIALTPLWNWLYKQLRGKPQPPCMDGACGSIPALGELVGDAEAAAEAKAFIAARMSELTDKQAELMRSVEVDMGEVVTKTGIGQGSFSIVYKGYYQNSHVAIKVLRKVDERNFRRFLEEILLHKDLRHPNIVMFRGASWTDGRLLMLVDYAGRGTLADVLRRSQGTLKWKLVKLNMVRARVRVRVRVWVVWAVIVVVIVLVTCDSCLVV
jgi:hypothetical protein